MKRFFLAALAVALLASSAMAADVASITEDFSAVTWGKAKLIYQNKNTTLHEIPDATYSSNGFKWGGWYPPGNGLLPDGVTVDATNDYRIQFGGQGLPNYTTTIPILQVGGNANVVPQAGGYAYTIFSTSVGVTAPDTVVNAASASITTPAANATVEETSLNIGLLLRDSTGAWFKQMDGYQPVSMTENVENTYTIAFAGKNFQQLTGAAPTDMNEMDSGAAGNADFTPGALDVTGSSNVAAPTSVTGMGIFNATNGTVKTGFKVKTITVSDVVPPATASVSVGSAPIADGETVPVDLGSYELGETATDVVFTVWNSGGAALTISEITAPTGVTIVDNLTAGDLAPNASDTFTVKLDTTAEVAVAGEISFTAGADTFNFAVSGNVGPVTAVREWEQY